MTIETGVSIGLLVFLTLLGVAVFVVITQPARHGGLAGKQRASLLARLKGNTTFTFRVKNDELELES